MQDGNQNKRSQEIDKLGSELFPSWDILPPFQFINPRVRSIEVKEETKLKQENSEGSDTPQPPKTNILFDTPKISNNIELEKCPACGASLQANAKLCQGCGISLNDSGISEQQQLDETILKSIKCPHCGEELELDDSDDGVGEYSYHKCGKDFELLG